KELAVRDVADPQDTEEERGAGRGERERQRADRPLEEGQEEGRSGPPRRGGGGGAAPVAVPAEGRAGLERLLRIVGLGLVHRVLDRRPVHQLELPLLHLGDDLLTEYLMDPPDEALGSLRVLDALRKRLESLEGLDERLLI